MDNLITNADKKILRAPSLKRSRNEERISERIKLERVLGVTVSSNATLCTDHQQLIAYPAGCTIIILNTKTEEQQQIVNVSRRTITSLAFSQCGRYIVAGECGHQPCARVWDLYSDLPAQISVPPSPHGSIQSQQVGEFFGHKYGISCVAFSPNGKYLVSVGTQHDMIVNVWEWKNNLKVASNKVSTKVKALAFAESGEYFVTVGNRHVKFWYLDHGKSKYKEAVPLMGRSAILGEQRNNYFCDVACGKQQSTDSTYAITRSGLLCEFNKRRLLDKWVELRTTNANCVSCGEQYIFVGCADGIIRCFDPSTLRFVTTLPRCHYLGVDVSQGTNIEHMTTSPAGVRYPDTIAITYNEITNKLASIYNDHSIYVWDVSNVKRVGKSFSFLYHSACIWGVEMGPPSKQTTSSNANTILPTDCFFTCSSDDTIRMWNLNSHTYTNIYSKELSKIIYADEELNFIKDLDLSVNAAGGVNSAEGKQSDNCSYDGRNGVRAIRLRPDGVHLASGDRSGNIRIFDISASMMEVCKIEAHDSEVLCLEYGSVHNMQLLASASRDRLLHVFDVTNGYELLQTLDDHSGSITAVRFLHSFSHSGSSETNATSNFQMISCGADKSLIFRSWSALSGQFVRDHIGSAKTTLYDMAVDAGQKYVVTACQDRNVRIYNVNSGKQTKSFKGSTGEDGTLIKVVLDRSGIYLVTSCTDKSVSVYDYYTGECMATMCGHSELVTGLRFSNDCTRLISVSGDGCIFIWRMPHDMVVTMQARLAQQAMRHGKPIQIHRMVPPSPHQQTTTAVFLAPKPPPLVINDSEERLSPDNEDLLNYRFSAGSLPHWAKRQLRSATRDDDMDSAAVSDYISDGQPKGRWAQRVEQTAVVSAQHHIARCAGPNQTRLDRTSPKHNVEHDSSVIGTNQKRDRDENGFESAEHDADIDSDTNDLGTRFHSSSSSFYPANTCYYPSVQSDSALSGSEFTVMNFDANELKKSQRAKRRVIGGTTTGMSSGASTYVSQDSDEYDDEDEVSTPSGDNTDRNPLSILSLSCESLDQLITREKYLQATFENIGAPVAKTVSSSTSRANSSAVSGSAKNSISSKFFTKSSDVNLAAINAVKHTKMDPEVQRKRQLLNKRIAETKKKLENVGTSFSRLKASHSTHDLSYLPERDPTQDQHGNQAYVDADDDDDGDIEVYSPDNSLRRSCSLSDLNMQKPLTTRNYPKGTLKKVGSNKSGNYQKHSTAHSSASVPKRQPNNTHLVPSDSEEDRRVTRLMRPTISSHNKTTKSSHARKRHSHSTSSLNYVGLNKASTVPNTTSDEDDDISPVSNSIVPTCVRLSSNTNYQSGSKTEDGSSSTKRASASVVSGRCAPSSSTNTKKVATSAKRFYSHVDVEVPLKSGVGGSGDAYEQSRNTELCQEVIAQLTRAASNVVSLYDRLKANANAKSSSSSSSTLNADTSNMIKKLELSILHTHKVLHDCIFNNSNGGAMDVNQTDTVKKLNDLVCNPPHGPNSVITMMEQYTDILLDMIQEKINHTSVS